MSTRPFIVEQFHKPSGPLGPLAGWIMATRGSNVERNRRTVSLLGIEEGDRVLELGFGPGVAVPMAAAMAGPKGRVIGIDHSPVMLAQAKRRNRALIRDGRVELMLLGLDRIQHLPGPFDRVFSSNVLQFQEDRVAVLRSLLRVMGPGARLATTFQPRMRNATAKDAEDFAADLVNSLRDAGYSEISTNKLLLSPVPAVCIVADAPGQQTDGKAPRTRSRSSQNRSSDRAMAGSAENRACCTARTDSPGLGIGRCRPESAPVKG
jgi:SAM-dependent methyltransferase